MSPFMLVAAASAGYSNRYGSRQFCLVRVLCSSSCWRWYLHPRYLGANVSTLPEFLGKRFGETTPQHSGLVYRRSPILFFLALVGFVYRRRIDKTMIRIGYAALCLYMMDGGSIHAVCSGGWFKDHCLYQVYSQMLLLSIVSLILVVLGVSKAIGLSAVYEKTPSNFLEQLFQPAPVSKSFPWPAILLGYPIMWCMVLVYRTIDGAVSIRG